MHEDIKKYADEGNTRELKYRFNNSLDIDPTFEKYIDDFEYCKTKNAFDQHIELTKFDNVSSNWNENYWANLKKDLFENFSQERLEHMIEVANVIYKDKIERLKRERIEAKNKISNNISVQKVNSSINTAEEKQEIERLRQKQLEEARKKLLQENNSFEDRQIVQKQVDESYNEPIPKQTTKRNTKSLDAPIIILCLVIGLLLGGGLGFSMGIVGSIIGCIVGAVVGYSVGNVVAKPNNSKKR